MPRAHIPTTDFGDADFLKQQYRKTRESYLQVRLQAIRFRMLGKTVSETCELLCISRDTLRKWVVKWNENGIDGLNTKPRSGRPRKLDSDIKDFVVKRIEGKLDNGEPFSAIAIHGYLKKHHRCRIFDYLP